MVSALWLHRVTLASEDPSVQIHVFPGDVVAGVAGLPFHQGCMQLSRNSFQAETRSVFLLLCLFAKGRIEERKKNKPQSHAGPYEVTSHSDRDFCSKSHDKAKNWFQDEKLHSKFFSEDFYFLKKKKK